MGFLKERRTLLTWMTAGALWAASGIPLRRVLAAVHPQLPGAVMQLPSPPKEGTVSVEHAISQRRTVRSFGPKTVTIQQIAALLWAGQGVTGSRGLKRAAPSAGALYPMDLYVAVGRNCVEGLSPGVYHYNARDHRLVPIDDQDRRQALARASLAQMWMASAPVNLIVTAEYQRITGKYGQRGVRYALIEAGHIGQNLFLQAEALGLKAGIVGAFHDAQVTASLKLPPSHEPILILPIGYAA